MNKQDDARAVLREVHRYRIANVESLEKSLVGIEVTNATQFLASRHKLRLKRHVSGLSYAFIPQRGLPSPTAIARSLAIHAFVCDSSQKSSLLNKHDLKKYFPDLFRSGLPRGYYVNTFESTPRLGLVRVDADPDDIVRIVQLAHRLIQRHQKLSGFRSLMATGQFEITFLVATCAKSRRLRLALDALSKSGVLFRSEAVPLLLDLVAPLPLTQFGALQINSNHIPRR